MVSSDIHETSSHHFWVPDFCVTLEDLALVDAAFVAFTGVAAPSFVTLAEGLERVLLVFDEAFGCETADAVAGLVVAADARDPVSVLEEVAELVRTAVVEAVPTFVTLAAVVVPSFVTLAAGAAFPCVDVLAADEEVVLFGDSAARGNPPATSTALTATHLMRYRIVILLRSEACAGSPNYITSGEGDER